MLYLFDIDGTLLLAGGAGRRAINRVFADLYGVDSAMDGVSPGGKTDAVIVSEAYRNCMTRDPTEEEVEEILARYLPLFRGEVAASPGFRIMPHAAEVLEHLGCCERAVLGIATGNIRGGAHAKLERAGLAHHFAFGGYGCDSRDRAVLVERAIGRGCDHVGAQVPRDQIAVVGDTVRDVDAARQCGVRAIAVTAGSQGAAELRNAAPDEIFETLAELLHWHHDQVCGECPTCRALLDGDDRPGQ